MSLESEMSVKLLYSILNRLSTISLGRIALERPAWHTLLETFIQLLIAFVLRLRKFEVDNYERNDWRGKKNLSHFSAKISLIWVEHVRDCNVPDGRVPVV